MTITSTIVKFLKKLGWAILIFIALVLLYLLAAFVLSRITVDGAKNEPEEMSIYIINNGVHTDIVMPVVSDIMDWRTKLPFENTISKDTAFEYVAMGWGDKGFYLETETWADLKPRVAINAAFGWNTTAMHVTYYKKMQEGEACRKIHLSKSQYKDLVNFIDNTFQRDDSNRYVYVQTDMQYGKNDAFYDANGSYGMFYTCNTWANNAIKAARLKSCLWTAFYKGIFLKYPLVDTTKH